jgi:hypothetical protein
MTSSRLAEARLSPNHIRFDAGIASDEMMPSSVLMRPSRRRGCYGRCIGSWPMSKQSMGCWELSCAGGRPRVATPHSRHHQSRHHPAYERPAPQHATSISTRNRPLAACIRPARLESPSICPCPASTLEQPGANHPQHAPRTMER